MDKGEGAKLKAYLKENKFNQQELAVELGYSDRHGLRYHFDKDVLDYEFKMRLRDKGVKLFDENGKLISTSRGKASSSSNAVLLEANDFTVMMVPLVNKYAYAGYQAGYGDDEYIEDLPKVPLMVDKEHKGTYRAFEVRGDSMDNGLVGSYQDGYIVYGREIPRHHWRDKLHIKKWHVFVIVTKKDGILIKEISKHDTAKGIITLHSWNEEYDDTEMHLDNVAQLLNVVQANFK